MRPITADQFLKDVANHAFKIHADNELYRHLYFRQPGNSDMWFEIVTWPGSLAINGDMGSWSFSRVDDMFTFFRQGQCSTELRINESYWHEKVQGESRFGGPSKRFDPDTFKANVLSSLDGYDLDDKVKAAIVAALDDERVFSDNEHESRRGLAEFKYTPDEGPDGDHRDFQFVDAWEISGKAYAYQFLWCLYAIVWAIQQYDAAKGENERL